MSGWSSLVIRNLGRSPLRVALTIVAVATSLVAFVLMQTVSAGWTEQVRQTPDDRVIVRSKMGWNGTLPVRYLHAVSEMQGVRRATGATWGVLALPFEKRVAFESTAVDAGPFIAMHYELHAPESQRRDFVERRDGAFVSEELAQEFGWKLGDAIHFKGTAFPGELALTVSGIYHSARQGFARRAVYFHWELLNETLPEPLRGRINIVAAEIYEPSQGARIARAIDIAFDQGTDQTLSQEDQAVNAQLVGQFSAILGALDFVSVLILGITLLIIANTLAMAIRERTKEYATLRAIGFRLRHLSALILAEAALLGFVGGVSGLLLSYPLIQQAASGYVQKSMNLAPLHITLESGALTIAVGAVLGTLAALPPVYQLTRTKVASSLRALG